MPGWNKKGGKTSGSGIGGQKVIMDRSSRRGGSDSDKKPIETENSIPDIQVEDPEQESKEIEGMWGFPHSLRDRYEPLGVAGDDSYARVYKVRKKESGALRALKVGHLKQPGSEILQKETVVWRSLRHPNIVHLFRSEFLDDMTFLENEYLEGLSYKGSLHTSLSGLPKPIREQYAVSLVRDIAEGLRYAHEIGVRHYHLQTGDILITPKLRAKISGFARGRNEFGFSIKDSDVRNATAAYITPEQKNETKYGNPGRRTDIYQLGVIFYELLTGFLPYSPEAFKKSGREGLYEEYKDELILPSEIRKNLVKYDPILIRMLSRKKSGRYDYMDEFIADLDALSRPKPVE
jgi:Serine/threonine protein kinase